VSRTQGMATLPVTIMIYKSAFRSIIYPAQTCEPRVTRYCIALDNNSRLVRSIIQLVADEPGQRKSPDLHIALDVILRRIIDAELMPEYPIAFNVSKVARPGLLATPPTRRTLADNPIYIRVLDVAAGSVAFFADPTGGRPVSNGVARILR
jgi:hypothetical protein